MFPSTTPGQCIRAEHFNRRTLLQAALTTAGCGAAWLTPLAHALARQSETAPRGAPAKSVIVLWLAGGPSQLETFDPHPNTDIAAGTKAIKTNVPGVQLGAGLEQTAELMDAIALVRSVTSKEGDHERATYNVKTGFRPDPTLVHPALGAVICHQLTDQLDIPRHVSILPDQWPARGGYLGDQFDAFKIGDPSQPIPDIEPFVDRQRFDRRLKDLEVVERAFARGRMRRLDDGKTLHGLSTRAAIRMMSSELLKAFNVKEAPKSLQQQFGETAFGRGCLAAAQLVEVGVRCVEVTLGGWDTHINNHELQAGRVEIMDPALAGLIRHLRQRKLLDSTLILCGGEFGRTPTVNPAGGRDHWPHGFTIALAGGGIRGGVVVGETSPQPKLDKKKPLQDVKDPVRAEDIHATVLSALGINFDKELDTPVNRPMAISQGKVIKKLLA